MPAAPASEPAAPASLSPPDRDPWQIGVGFLYSHYNVLGQTFHDFGYQADVTRYFNNWFGVEGATTAGFGQRRDEFQRKTRRHFSLGADRTSPSITPTTLSPGSM